MIEAHRIRVYYEDTDAGGVVHHAAYVRFFERARTEWLRRLGVEQRALAAAKEILFAVRKITVEYKQPAMLDDLLSVTNTPVHCGRASVVFEQQLSRDNCELATAQTLVVCVRANPLRTASLPASLRARLLEMMEKP